MNDIKKQLEHTLNEVKFNLEGEIMIKKINWGYFRNG